MTEPVYNYIKGKGWIPSVGPVILTPEDCQGEWWAPSGIYYLPPICKNWNILPSTGAIKPGDLIPYSSAFGGDGFVRIITSATETTADYIQVSRGGVYQGRDTIKINQSYVWVARHE